jgi:hypothetical protein
VADNRVRFTDWVRRAGKDLTHAPADLARELTRKLRPYLRS